MQPGGGDVERRDRAVHRAVEPRPRRGVEGGHAIGGGDDGAVESDMRRVVRADRDVPAQPDAVDARPAEQHLVLKLRAGGGDVGIDLGAAVGRCAQRADAGESRGRGRGRPRLPAARDARVVVLRLHHDLPALLDVRAEGHEQTAFQWIDHQHERKTLARAPAMRIADRRGSSVNKKRAIRQKAIRRHDKLGGEKGTSRIFACESIEFQDAIARIFWMSPFPSLNVPFSFKPLPPRRRCRCRVLRSAVPAP